MLEIVLIIVLLLNYFQIILIKLLIFVLGLSLILRKLIVLYNSLIWLIVLLNQKLWKTDYCFLIEETRVFSYFINDFFSSLNLADKAIGLSLFFDCLKQLL